MERFFQFAKSSLIQIKSGELRAIERIKICSGEKLHTIIMVKTPHYYHKSVLGGKKLEIFLLILREAELLFTMVHFVLLTIVGQHRINPKTRQRIK